MEELEKLREEIKELKTKTGLPYSFLSKKILMKKQSFYNFMGGTKGLSEEKQELLKQELRRLK